MTAWCLEGKCMECGHKACECDYFMNTDKHTVIPNPMSEQVLKISKGPSIIVVGPDGVGKTTVVKLLSERLGVPSFKCPAEKRIFREGGRSSLAFDYTMTHFLEQTGYRFVSDRGYPCEWTYSKVFYRDSDPQLLQLIDSGHAYLGTRILYLYSSVRPFQDDDIVPPERYFDVKRTYDSFCEWTSCRVVAFDTADMLMTYRDGGDSSRDVMERCLKLMEDK